MAAIDLAQSSIRLPDETYAVKTQAKKQCKYMSNSIIVHGASAPSAIPSNFTDT